jgi:hypothetical protein
MKRFAIAILIVDCELFVSRFSRQGAVRVVSFPGSCHFVDPAFLVNE